MIPLPGQWPDIKVIGGFINRGPMIIPDDDQLSDFSAGFLAGALADDNCAGEDFENIEQIIRGCYQNSFVAGPHLDYAMS